MKLCIDAGHGGKDPGAVSKGKQEKDIVLSIAMILADLLRSQGIEVFMTRTNDTYDTVNEKARKANASGADYFISIHCNSAASIVAKGAETLIFGYDGKSDILAENIQKHLVKGLGLVDRGIKVRRDLAVLNSTRMSAVLVETAFLSNDEDRGKLVDRQKDFAGAIANGVMEYFEMEEIEMVEKSKMIVDGKEVEVERILKDGTNYVKVRDIARALGITWGGSWKTPDMSHFEITAVWKEPKKEEEEEVEKVYNKIEEVPDWAKQVVSKLINHGSISGNASGLGLTESMLRLLVINDREGLYK